MASAIDCPQHSARQPRDVQRVHEDQLPARDAGEARHQPGQLDVREMMGDVNAEGVIGLRIGEWERRRIGEHRADTGVLLSGAGELPLVDVERDVREASGNDAVEVARSGADVDDQSRLERREDRSHPWAKGLEASDPLDTVVEASAAEHVVEHHPVHPLTRRVAANWAQAEARLAHVVRRPAA